MTETKQKEVWKPYPDYPFIEANQFGEIRTKDRYVPCRNGGKRLVKGHVLKQYLSKRGYMYVQSSMNKKKFHLFVHRIVATCFIPNPNNYPEVNHIDNDPTNNRLDNLEWCTDQYNQDYKKNFGTSSAEVLGKHVFAVDLKTGKVLRFETQAEAARQLGIEAKNFNNVIEGKLNQIGGYWLTEDESEITEEKIREIKAKMHFFGSVIAINIETHEIFWFDSQYEASRQLNVHAGNMNGVIKGRRNRAGGYWFCYADKNAVEKARAKFGDKIAKKVEELIGENYE